MFKMAHKSTIVLLKGKLYISLIIKFIRIYYIKTIKLNTKNSDKIYDKHLQQQNFTLTKINIYYKNNLH